MWHTTWRLKLRANGRFSGTHNWHQKAFTSASSTKMSTHHYVSLTSTLVWEIWPQYIMDHTTLIVSFACLICTCATMNTSTLSLQTLTTSTTQLPTTSTTLQSPTTNPQTTTLPPPTTPTSTDLPVANSTTKDYSDIISDEIEKLQSSGYLFFPHIYRAFLDAGRRPLFYNSSEDCSRNLESYYNAFVDRDGWAWNSKFFL